MKRASYSGGGRGKVYFKMIQKRIDANDSSAIYQLGDDYLEGYRGLAKDFEKAFELHSRAAKLGHDQAHARLHDAMKVVKVLKEP